MLPKTNAKWCDKDIGIRGCHCWNDLDKDIKSATSSKIFKKCLKVYGQEMISKKKILIMTIEAIIQQPTTIYISYHLIYHHIYLFTEAAYMCLPTWFVLEGT